MIDVEPSNRNKKQWDAVVWQFLITVNPMVKFCDQVKTVISSSVNNMADWKPLPAAAAFNYIEQFALNLVDYPWQKEFRVIKVT